MMTTESAHLCDLNNETEKFCSECGKEILKEKIPISENRVDRLITHTLEKNLGSKYRVDLHIFFTIKEKKRWFLIPYVSDVGYIYTHGSKAETNVGKVRIEVDCYSLLLIVKIEAILKDTFKRFNVEINANLQGKEAVDQEELVYG